MSALNHGAGPSSSPHSSEDRNFGTPSTNLTNFSPATASTAEGKTRTRDLLVKPLRIEPPALRVEANKPAGDDVFYLATPTAVGPPALSPTAKVFTPGLRREDGIAVPARLNGNAIPDPRREVDIAPQARLNGNAVPGPRREVDIFAQERPNGNAVPYLDNAVPHLDNAVPYLDNAVPYLDDVVPYMDLGPHQDLVGGFIPDERNFVANQVVHLMDAVQVRAYPIENAQPQLPDFFANVLYSHLRVYEAREGTFSHNDNSYRHLTIHGGPLTDRATIEDLFNVGHFPSLVAVQPTALRSVWVIDFSDSRETADAVRACEGLYTGWRASIVPPSSAAELVGIPSHHVSNYEAFCIIHIHTTAHPRMRGALPVVSPSQILEEAKSEVESCGPLKAFVTAPSPPGSAKRVVIEFYDEKHAKRAEHRFKNPKAICEGDCLMDVQPCIPDVILDARRNSQASLNSLNSEASANSLDSQASVISEMSQLSVTGRTVVPVDPEYERLAGVYQRGDYHHNGRRGNNNNNAVDIHRIRAGIDVRTTHMLKKILDETSFGVYDFMYLRIDFANNCNVGYAFINFIDAPSIVPFLLARAGKRWNCFSSDKVAEISYATIQGKDCLVQKFRNSSVMLEHPSFRPKLFITTGPRAGEEEKFPDPDNPSKMRRSVENAEHVGLFYPKHRHFPMSYIPNMWRGRQGVFLPPARANLTAPMCPAAAQQRFPIYVDTKSPTDPFAGAYLLLTQGQAYREEQRRRRSQFDRGTPGAEHELQLAARNDRLRDPALSPEPYRGGTFFPRY